MKRTKSVLLAVFTACLVAATPAMADQFPSRPIKILHPFSAGSATDAALRLISRKATEIIGQQIVVENRPSSGGILAMAALKNATPDGYTLMQGSQGMFAVAPHLMAGFAYDPRKDFQPVAQLWESNYLLIVPASSPVKSAADLIALARQKQGGLSNATQGVGSAAHLSGAIMEKALGIPLTHVPYSGGAAAKPDLLTGRVDMSFVIYGIYKPEIENGTVRVLGITTPERVAVWPQIPTLAGAGYGKVEYVEWFGLFGPPGMDPSITRILNEAFSKAATSPEAAGALASTNSFIVKAMTPEALGKQVEASYAEMKKLAADMGLQAQ